MRNGPLVVIGDTLLDIDVEGTVVRLCADAPVPVVDRTNERERAGGAGLAARLVAGLTDRDVVLVTAVGDDPAGRRAGGLVEAYAEVVRVPMAGMTSTKTRILVAGRTLCRLDQGDGQAAAGPLPARAEEVLKAGGAVLVSDYGRGVTAHREIHRLLAGLPDGTPVVWDPHPHGSAPRAGTRLVTPNETEARTFAGSLVDAAEGPFARAAADSAVLVDRWRVTGVAVTLGPHGALLSFGQAVPFIAPAAGPGADHHVDACGAGDCFAAAATHVLHGGGTLTEAVTEAVRRAGDFVHAGGVRALDRTPRRAASPPAPGDQSVWETVRGVRENGGRVVATGGCFDLLHAGHVSLLHAARRLGDCLVVCANSDASVRALKGPDRPLVPVADRVRVLAALECVDAVAVFDELTPTTLLKRLRPDLWVKGGDYSGIDLAEAEVVRRNGGQVVLLPYLDGRSTTALVTRARNTAGISTGGDHR